jgi:hypothetical protein
MTDPEGGNERLTRNSKGANKSGVLFFEVRNKTAFLMFALRWDNDYASQHETALSDIVSSYREP